VKISKPQHVIGTTILFVWILSWVFARDIVKGLESLGFLPKRGLVFSDASDFAFSLAVCALCFCLWAVAAVFLALSGKVGAAPVVVVADADPRYAELIRQKELLLRELKELEFDRHLRKISDEDYVVIEARMRQRATAILRALDELDPVRLYGDRIREDLKAYQQAMPPPVAGAHEDAAPAADRAWRDEILARPLYAELVPVLGERDLLIAALCDLWIVAAEVDRSEPTASLLTVEDRRAGGERFQTTLGGLRARVIASLREGAGGIAQTLRLAELAGVPAAEPRAPELRERVLAALSRELGIGAAA